MFMLDAPAMGRRTERPEGSSLFASGRKAAQPDRSAHAASAAAMRA
jgi:hypothetical protein